MGHTCMCRCLAAATRTREMHKLQSAMLQSACYCSTSVRVPCGLQARLFLQEGSHASRLFQTERIKNS
jgi:hypothetical protein